MILCCQADRLELALRWVLSRVAAPLCMTLFVRAHVVSVYMLDCWTMLDEGASVVPW